MTAGDDGTARIWDARSGAQLKVLRGQAAYNVDRAAFSPDGERVVTAGGDGTARIWDANSGAQLESLPSNADFINSATFSPDGKQVVTASGDGTARIWACGVACDSVSALLERASQGAGTLTASERDQYLPG